jgi:hypothetical protein
MPKEELTWSICCGAMPSVRRSCGPIVAGNKKSGKIPQIPHESERPHQGVWNRMRLRSGRLLICEKPDTYCPQGEVHDCAGGVRAACGIIEAVEK